MNSPAFPWIASPVFHFRFYQHTSILLWSGDTVCRRMNRLPYSGEKRVRVEGYQGTPRDEIGIRSSFYLFNEWTRKWTLTKISCRWPYITEYKRCTYLHPRFQKERRSIKMPLSVNVNEVLAFRKYVRNAEPVVKLWYGNFIQIPKCATFTFLQIAFPIDFVWDFTYSEVYDNEGIVPLRPLLFRNFNLGWSCCQ